MDATLIATRIVDRFEQDIINNKTLQKEVKEACVRVLNSDQVLQIRNNGLLVCILIRDKIVPTLKKTMIFTIEDLHEKKSVLLNLILDKMKQSDKFCKEECDAFCEMASTLFENDEFITSLWKTIDNVMKLSKYC